MTALSRQELERISKQIREQLRRLHLKATEGKANSVAKLYSEAAEEVAKAFAEAAAAGEDGLTDAALREVIKVADRQIELIARKRDELINQSIDEGAQRGAALIELLQRGLAVGTDDLARLAVLGIAFDRENTRAAEAIRRKVYNDGLNLSKRLWRLNQRTRAGLNRLLVEGVQHGRAAVEQAKKLAAMDIGTPAFPKYLQRLEKAAREIAAGTGDRKRFEAILAAVRREVDKRKRGPLGMYGPTKRLVEELAKANAEGIDRAIREWLGRKARYNATVITRHETNEAFREARLRASEDKPWVIGIRWRLSRSHPREDECDDLATADQGLGPGVYPKGQYPKTPHPQCLCFPEEVIDYEYFERQRGDATKPGKRDIIKVDEFEPLGGGVSETFTGLVNGQKYVFKANSIPRGLSMSRSNLEAELLSERIFNLMGVKAPRTAYGRFDTGAGIQELLQMEFVEGEPLARVLQAPGNSVMVIARRLDQAQFRRMQVLDVLVGNGDRHNKNLLIDAKGGFIPIDHNLAFATDMVIQPGTRWQKNFLSEIPVDWSKNSLQHILHRNSIGEFISDDLGAFDQYYQAIAEVEQKLTDGVIDSLVAELPEALADSARRKELIRILRKRRDQLRSAFEEYERILRSNS
ncbi:MAG: hypothetical protein QME79_12495 [Bacillota bacterium]|nr:hypothetical protein [Bacillota bacterium]